MRKFLSTFCIFAYSTSIAFGLCANPRKGIEVARVSHPDLTENSGIDFSNRHPGIYWSLNDSGNPSEIFAGSIDGKAYGKFTIKDAHNIDWEDISVAKCLHREGKDCIYIGDIGDNFRLREEFRVYVVEEPAEYKTGGTLELVKTITFKVKARPNFEAFMVNESTRELYFISKNDKLNFPGDVATIFTLKEGADTTETLGVLDFRTLTIPLKKKDKVITAADFDTASGTLLLGTYDNAFELRLADLGSFKDKVRKIKVPEQVQGEAIAYYWRDGKPNIVTTSEGKNSPLYLIQCQ